MMILLLMLIGGPVVFASVFLTARALVWRHAEKTRRDILGQQPARVRPVPVGVRIAGEVR